MNITGEGIQGVPRDIDLNSVNIMGTSGGYVRKKAESTITITSAASRTITLSIPSGAKLHAAQMRVDVALTAGDTWDAVFTGGSSTAIASNQAVTKNTKVNKIIVDEITSDVTNVILTKNGGGSFTAATPVGVIRAIAYYEDLNTLVSL